MVVNVERATRDVGGHSRAKLTHSADAITRITDLMI